MSPTQHGGRRARDIFIATVTTVAVAVAGTALVSSGNTPTPPPSGTECLVSNWETWEVGGLDCDVGTTINVTNDFWDCTAAVSTYGTPPIRINSHWTTSVDAGGRGAVDFLNGCSGDGDNDTVDFVVNITGVNGSTGGVGNSDDAIKFRQSPGPQNIQVTGVLQCGAPPGGAHPDVIQIQYSGDRNITVVNGLSGDTDAGTSTCQGAGGIIYTSGDGFHLVGGEYTLCNHALNGTQAGPPGSNNTVLGGLYRGGRVESVASGGDPNCQGFSGVGGCTGRTNFDSFVNVTCEDWSATLNQWVTDFD